MKVAVKNSSNPKYDVLEIPYSRILKETPGARLFSGWDGGDEWNTAWVSKAPDKTISFDPDKKVICIKRWLFEGISAKETRKRNEMDSYFG